MAEGKIFLDQRAHSRMLVKLPVTFNILAEKSKGADSREYRENQRNAESWDTSLGGMYLVSGQDLKPGDHLSLKFSLPQSSGPLKVLADVVWADGTGAGLRFVAMKDADIQTLEAFLNKLSENGPSPRP